ncbi:MAG TPA: exodeoxyribonuclease V subunit gamma [Solirubrobacteraceae bacterium]|nr:exodeoxyribonuclease V subunit gamma [Solirubrobacteraceae bacterium]
MLHVHRAERADGLIDALGALIVDPLPDPFAAEVVCVPTRGMERWLTQRLSGRLGATRGRSDGVCANVEFPWPRRLVGDAIAAASGIEPDDDPWLPEHAVWSLLEVVDAALHEPWLHSLSLHLGNGADAPGNAARRGRRFAVVRHLADLFDRYALHRPEMAVAWASGEDTDGAGEPLSPNAAWQAELWRCLRQRIGQPGPAERLAGACAQLESRPDCVQLPQRVSLFGLTRLPAGHLHVLRALAAKRDVHLFLLHPSPVLWDHIAGSGPRQVTRRKEDTTATDTTNRLLASWGQDAREMQLVLAGAATHNRVDHHHAVTHRDGALLARVQADIRNDRRPPGPPLPGDDDARPTLQPDDRSIQIHSCHGRARQVEVLRDAILHLLEEDPTLEPRDVIVMCPDIETFAPLIHATFGAGDTTDAEDLEQLPSDVRSADLGVRLADRSIRQTNPVLGVVGELIDLVDQRLTASQLLDLADREPVRRRFRLDDDDLARMQDWVADSGIRWGLDAPHRAAFKLDSLHANTWRAGLDRILVGATMTEDEQRLFGGVLPLDDVDSGSIALAGRFAELVDRIDAAIDALAQPKTVAEWAVNLATATDELTATSPGDAWQRSELQRLLDDVVEQSAQANPRIALPELRSLLAERLQGRPTRSNFRTGHLTICTLVPMRSVPHRVVCLLGLDDGVFPRKAPRDGDDLMVDAPRIGERDPRTEDRQMLLDALLAATDRLIITYAGNDERTNTPRPAAVPVGELLDILDATVRTDTSDGAKVRDHVIVRHPLQPFDPRNFTRGRLHGDEPWSFDHVTLEGARALTRPRETPGPFLENKLPPLEARVVELDDLVRFAQHPARAFLRRRLRISLADFSDEIEDDLSVELDGLEKWGVGQRLLDARLAGVDPRTAALAEIARGTLPPGVLGKPVIDEVFPIVETIVTAAQDLVDGSGPSTSIDVRVQLPDGRSLGGTVPGVSGDMLRTVTYSRVAPKHRMTSWVRLLALTAADPERPYAAATIGRAGRSNVTIARVRPLGDTAHDRRRTALEHLATLLDLHDRGMREPLPLYCATSAAYAAAAGHDAATAAGDAWTSEYDFDKEDREPEHRLVLNGVLAIKDLLQERSRPDEQGDGWDPAESTRLGRLAHRMWDGLLACEEFGS